MGIFKRGRKHKGGSKSAYWYGRYAINGKIRWKSLGKVGVITKDVASTKIEQIKREIRLGQLDMIDVEILTLSDFTREYLHYVRDVSRKRLWKRDVPSLKHLDKFFGQKKLSAISPGDIQDYISVRLNDSKKPGTINRELACLKHLINIAKQRNKFFGDNPVSKVKFLTANNQIERILIPREEQQLLSCSAPHLIPIILTAINTGMRKGVIGVKSFVD